MTTIHLHFGRAKTGTTVLQAWLACHRDWLRARGVHYLDTADGGRGTGHQQFAKAFITRPPSFMAAPRRPQQTLDAAREELVGVAEPAIVISSENFPLADLDALRRFLTETRSDAHIRILFFARSQDELAESQYNQMVKLKQETRSFSEYAQDAMEGGDYLELTRQWEAVFGRGNISCDIYDARAPRIVDAFLGLIPELRDAIAQRPADPASEAGTANAGVGIQALTVMRLLNRVDIEDRAKFYSDLQQRFAPIDWPSVLFTSEWGRQFRARYAESNRRFSERYLGQALADLGGRRYGDDERDRLRSEIRSRVGPDAAGMPDGTAG